MTIKIQSIIWFLDCLDLFLATLCFLIPFDLLLLATVVSASLQTASHPETFSASIDSSIVKLFFPRLENWTLYDNEKCPIDDLFPKTDKHIIHWTLLSGGAESESLNSFCLSFTFLVRHCFNLSTEGTYKSLGFKSKEFAGFWWLSWWFMVVAGPLWLNPFHLSPGPRTSRFGIFVCYPAK